MTNNGFECDKTGFGLSADSVMLTQYSSEASQLIKSFTKNIPFVVIILILIVSMTTLDLVMDLGLIRILSDETIDAMIIAVSLFLILFTLFAVRPVLRSRKILEKWSNLFENNAIRTGIILTIKDKSKEEILYALPEVINQIAIPLEYYLSKSDKKEFYNVNIDDITTFDILIDKSTIKSIDSGSLKNVIQEYGSILIKIVDKVIDKSIAQDFLTSLQKYKKRGNKIGLAMIIGESISQESYILANKIKDKTISENLILIEKPVNNRDYDLKSLNNVST
ncbi:MAG: hypothetical protein EHM25_09820 [Nitrosopumilales archaeon]|nr:MAG: hypothetical protein EHM25_09820 [Nitrosopumilales archaeon]